MKIRHFLMGMLAMAAFAACEPEKPAEEAKLDVNKTAVELAATAAEGTFEVTANQDWTATADADWVTLDPASGAASAEAVTVKVTATDNATTEARTAIVTVAAGELVKTVSVSQAGTEPEPEPDPVPEVPTVDWTSESVVSYDLPEGASSKRQVLKNIKYTFDANYFIVKLQASLSLFNEQKTEYLGVFIYDVTNGSGDGYYGWWNGAKGNNEFEGEHIGTFSGTDLTLTIGETPVAVEKEENGDNLVWTLTIPRSAHANLALENPNFAFLTYVAWEPNGALPDKYENMLQFTPAAEPEVDVDIDGKQWEFTWMSLGGASCVFDFGVTMPDVFMLAYDLGALDPSYAGIFYPYIVSEYSITKTDGTSGVVTLSLEGQTIDLPYLNATENSVDFTTAMTLGEDISCTLATSLVQIYFEAAAGLADGEYWIVAEDKVATPLTGNYGYLQTADAAEGMVAANAFTFTQVETGLYTIQDSNGKYYYQTGTYNSFNVSDKDGGTDEYLWEVYNTGDGTYAIINCSVAKFVQYDPTYGTFASYADEKGVLPTLVAVE